MLDTILDRPSDRLPYLPEMPILIVVEDDDVRHEMGCRLMSAGYATDLAENGEHAIDLFRQDSLNYSAILMERQMSGLDGEETMTVLRCLGCDAPVVFLDDEFDMFELESAICSAV